MTYQPCPNRECQGLIGPDCIHAGPWVQVPKGSGGTIFRMQRRVHLFCETCRTAFEFIHDYNESLPVEMHAYRDDKRIAAIKRNLLAFADQLEAAVVKTYRNERIDQRVVGVA